MNKNSRYVVQSDCEIWRFIMECMTLSSDFSFDLRVGAAQTVLFIKTKNAYIGLAVV